MAMKYLVAAIFIASVVGIEACPRIQGCTFQGSDCKTLKCSQSILGKTVYLTIKLNTCETDISVTITIDEYSTGVHYSHTFTGDKTIPIPGLYFPPLGSASFRVKVQRNGRNLRLQLDLVVKVAALPSKSFTIVNEDLGSFSRGTDCGFSAWFENQSDVIKALVIGGSIGFVLLVTCCICCCCCCCKKRRAEGGAVFVTQGATSMESQMGMSAISNPAMPHGKY